MTSQPAVSIPSRDSRVMVTAHGPRHGQKGVVVGPDQRFFPRPRAVFVQFDSGRTLLIDVADLTVTPEG
ncbi:MAG: hypothetical protein ACT4NY_03705 [Pseudonocardiales bacterium]